MTTWKTSNNLKIIQVISGRSKVFLLTNEKHNILIDTGHKSKRSKLERALTNLKVKYIDYLVLTHSHFDHAGNAEYVKEKFNAKVIIHASEYEYLKTGNSPLPKGSIFPTKFIIWKNRTY